MRPVKRRDHLSWHRLIASFILIAITTTANAAPIVELTTASKAYVGRSIAHNKEVCWLADRSGSYEQIYLPNVKSFRKIPGTFKPLTAIQIRSQLIKEYRDKYEVVITGDYVVCAPRGKGRIYANLFDQVARSFSVYFSRRGFRKLTPEYPLVAIVFASQREFADYCSKDQQKFSPLLQGYYHPHSNRVVLFDPAEEPGKPNLRTMRPLKPSPFSFAKATADSTGPRDTIIHEAIHQLAFNTGLHSRIGKNPRWVVEGLAMMLEVDANRGNAIGAIKSRAHPERLQWFLKYRESEREETIAQFISNEEKYFSGNILSAYSQAWALTYFLAETRSAEYADYLRRISARDGLLKTYSPQDRLSDFQASFGDDLDWLEVQFMRFVDKLE